MYESYWKLNSRPFAQRGEPARFFPGQSHQSALLRLGYGLQNLSGPALILGPSGVGKTSLVRLFAAEHPARQPFVNLVFPALKPEELLRCVAGELSGSGPGSEGGIELVPGAIRDSLRKLSAGGHQPILAFDDAQQLSDDCLQNVILPLLNLIETDSGIDAGVLLIGQPVLAAHVRRIHPLAERISVTTPVSGWSGPETISYLTHCLSEAGGRPDIFSRGAMQRLFELTGGNPRRVNRLADMALVVGFADALPQITESQIDAVSCELLPAAA